MNPIDLSAFLIATIALNASPGPSMAYIATRTIAQGKSVGIASAVGVTCGALIHAALVVAGISILLLQTTLFVSALKYLGSIYLAYLGIKMIFSSRTNQSKATPKSDTRSVHAFRDGIIVNFLNPGTAAFFLAFLPQFITAESELIRMQLLFLSIAYNIIGLSINILTVYISIPIQRTLQKGSAISTLSETIAGIVLILLSIRLYL